ncbi:hypothetical protein GF362_05175 [Candidatus Dojkabacteria bacterium]|nr:hypothetical protein [Candidatus Dojkabacteria bacterium]
MAEQNNQKNTPKAKIKKQDKSQIEDNLRKKQQQKMESESLERKIKLYYVPIFSLIIFAAILFYATIPQIKEMYKSLEDKEKVEAELQQAKVELTELQQLRESNQLNSELLDRLNLIIPTSKTEVVSFEEKLRQIGFETIVDLPELITGERILENEPEVSPDGETSQGKPQLKLVQIATELSLTAPLQNFRDFLSAIYTGSDFIVITEMELENQLEGNSKMEIALSKYQYLPIEDGEKERQLLDSVSYKEKLDEVVIDFIERKSDTTTHFDTVEEEYEVTDERPSDSGF